MLTSVPQFCQVSYFVLIFDWISNLRNEYFMVIKPKNSSGSESNRYLSLKPVFLLSRLVFESSPLKFESPDHVLIYMFLADISLFSGAPS